MNAPSIVAKILKRSFDKKRCFNIGLFKNDPAILTPVSPVPIDPESTCDCVTQALWQRNLAWTR